MFGISEELHIVLVAMGNLKERIILLLVASAVLFVSIFVIMHLFMHIHIAL